LGAYKSIYSFQAEPDGRNPLARLTPLDGALYGTTSAGGRGCGLQRCGTIYKITTTGTETVVYRFRGDPDGATPLAELTAVKQTLYGTTFKGGTHCVRKTAGGCGVVFAINTSGMERVLHRFIGTPDGAYPQGPLTLVNGRLYGTTTAGGAKCADQQNGCGIVYSIDTSGKEHVLYRFKGMPDGVSPSGNLVLLNGILYGTTYGGGAHGGGTVFAITPSGRERILYSSKGIYDMFGPSGLVAMAGILYGASYGGDKHNGGTVYAVTTSGKERLLHDFGGTIQNGQSPVGSLIVDKDLLYGTTSYGGLYLESGVIYAVSSSRGFHVVYRFKAPPDGTHPEAGLTEAGGALYGTTYSGGRGCYHYGCEGGYGTVFRLLP
jgi:uncharacterized repeat protein (TIGR03803 family)